MRLRLFLPLASLGALALAIGPVEARDPPTPQQRIERLEKQVRQVQRQVFPKGQPADTAGVIDAPAATQDSVTAVAARLDAAERQMAELVRASEENGNRLSVIEADLARLRAESDARFRALQNPAPETVGGDAVTMPDAPLVTETVPAPVIVDEPKISRPKVESGPRVKPATTSTAPADGAEAAYDAGFRLWEARKYDQAIAALTTLPRDYPASRRVSWAYNLIGRAQLDKGDYSTAAATLLKNYRRDPQGERAQDSVFYLGQALTKLKQPGQACKAYAELEDVYGKAMRPQLRALLPAAKAEARCS